MVKKFSCFVDMTLFRFLLVGVFNTVFGITLMFLLHSIAGFGYWGASSTVYLLGTSISYFLNKNFTFRQKHAKLRSFFVFYAIVSICYLISFGMSRILVQFLSEFIFTIKDYSTIEQIAMLIGMCIFTALNYFGQKFVVFKK